MKNICLMGLLTKKKYMPYVDKYFACGLWEVPVVPLQTFCLASERLICMVGILIYRILCLSLGCDSWYATML